MQHERRERLHDHLEICLASDDVRPILADHRGRVVECDLALVLGPVDAEEEEGTQGKDRYSDDDAHEYPPT